MDFNIALDLLSTQVTYPSLTELITELIQGSYDKMAGDSKPVWDVVIRFGAIGVVIITLYSIQDEDTDYNLDFNAGCVMFLAALVFIVPALFVFVISLWMAIIMFIVFLTS